MASLHSCSQLAMLAFLSLLLHFMVVADNNRPAQGEKQWSYNENTGPEKWPDLFPHRCGGRLQSPISIEPKKTSYEPRLEPLKVSEDTRPLVVTKDGQFGPKLLLTNDGKTLSIEVDGDYKISGLTYGKDYKITTCYLRWGPNNLVGSEHQIEGKSFPLEFQMVSYDAGRFPNFEEGSIKFKGLTGIAILFTIGEFNPALDGIISQLDKVTYPSEDGYLLRQFKLTSIMPRDTSRYFQYHGSLTVPNCWETVMWNVFQQPLTLSQEQMDALRTKVFQSTSDGGFKNMLNSFRKVQPVNQRELERSFQSIGLTNAATSQVPRVTGMLAALLYVIVKA